MSFAGNTNIPGGAGGVLTGGLGNVGAIAGMAGQIGALGGMPIVLYITLASFLSAPPGTP